MSPPAHALRRIVCGPDAAIRLEEASRWLADRGPTTELAVVGASMQAAADLTRSLGRDVGACFGWHRFTLVRLAWSLAEGPMAARGLLPVGGLSVEAVCARVVYGAAAQGRLGRFAPIADRPGLPRGLARSFSELRLEGQTPLALGEAIGDADLARLLADYEGALKAARLADRADLFAMAAEVARSGHPSLGRPMLFLDVPIAAGLELALVRAILAHAHDVLFTFPEGDERTKRRLEGLGIAVDVRLPVTRTSLERLKVGLFAETAEPPAEGTGVAIFSAPGESRECVEIARLIHRQAEHGVAFDRIAVLLRSPLHYRAHLEEAFRRAGIPAHFARGTAHPDPAGRAFLALLACGAEGLSAARFAEFLSLGEVPSASDQGAPPPPLSPLERWVPADDELMSNIAGLSAEEEPEAALIPRDSEVQAGGPVSLGTLRAPTRIWERLLIDASVIGGLDRWRRRLAGFREELALEEKEIDDPDDARALRLRRDREALDGLRTYALPLLEDVAKLPTSAPWGVWLDRLGALATRALRRPERVLSALAELQPMADVGPIELGEVRIVLEGRLGEVVVPPSERRFGKVFVASTEQARGLAFDVVFVPGLAEKLFPQKVIEDPILPDRVRKGLGLPTNADRSAAERLALRMAIGAARERVVVSYPRLDLEQSRPRTPSFYGLEVLRAAEGELPGFDELARRSNVTGVARVGWPAPTRAQDAIDDAEHDLALLNGVLQRSEAESIGMARYLLSSNAHLARALRARARRWHWKWWGADGLVSPAPEALAVLAKHRLTARSYSPTGLQNFAACPYRFVLQAIHRLAPREEPAALEELDPLQKGSLIHETLFELHGVLRQEALLPVTPQNLEAARAHLDFVLERVAGRYKDKLAPAIERVWDDAVAGIRADLREWLRRASLDPFWKPLFFELSFGLDDKADRDPQSTSAAAPLDCGIQLRGSIDLVEQNEAGLVRATDYKTGKVRAKQGTVIEGGAILQPVLYALALEKVLAGSPRVQEGRLYYCTTVGAFTEVEVPLNGEARDAAALLASTVSGALAEAFLPAAPAEKACEYCDYLQVCGPYEEERTKRKKQEELAPLKALRKHR
jgi:ATP-dependent helicase/nuclease subunit B